MGLGIAYTPGQTPLDEDEADGLLIPTIATHGELDEFEQQNIEQAIQWTLERKFKQGQVLQGDFVKDVHRKMFGDVWAWAGVFRKTNKNIGIDYWKVETELQYLMDDITYWINNKTYAPDEISIRFKHRIVSIHCFPNGNGRHSRLMADIIIEDLFKLPVFTWGASKFQNSGDARTTYLAALKTADAGNIEPLISFARD
ncbi:MAG TPA: mobile mystery protein B [Ohtaekwangia sp.]|nr:mobile mystery protein B [Ohtaekwangia sp.]